LNRAQTIEALSAGREVEVREALDDDAYALLEALRAASEQDLAAEPARDAALQELDAALIQLLTRMVTLVRYGSADAVADVTRALRQVALTLRWDNGAFGAVVEAALGRLLWSTVALALHFDQLQLLPSLNRVLLPQGWSGTVPLPAAGVLRSGRHYGGRAARTLAIYRDWFERVSALGGPALALPELGRDEAFDEADLLLALRMAGEHGRKVFCPGAGRDQRRAEQNLLARLADPVQREQLAAFVRPGDAPLEEVLAARYANLVGADEFGVGALFAT
jgi:hypothetical protein